MGASVPPENSAGSMPSGEGWTSVVALMGFVLVTMAQVSNMILARGPFSLAFFRWTIIAAGLAPFADRRNPTAAFTSAPPSSSMAERIRGTGFMEYRMGTAASVRLDVGRDDHLAPFVGLVRN